MAKNYDGWIAKDQDGEYWLGTLTPTKEETEAHILKQGEWSKKFKFQFVKVKLVEVED